MTEEEREAIRDATDIAELIGEDVELRERGGRLWGSCPFHEDHHPSMLVDPTRGGYHCFSCQAHGDVFEYVMQTKGMSFPEASAYLARRAGIEPKHRDNHGHALSRERLSEAIDAACGCMRSAIAESEAARSWLAKHSIDESARERWGIGLAPGGETLCRALRDEGFTDDEIKAAGILGKDRDTLYRSACLPVLDPTGNTVGIVGQTITPISRTVTSRGTALRATPVGDETWQGRTPFVRNALVGLDIARKAIGRTGTAIVTLGPLETVALHELGIANAMSCVGSGISTRQMSRILAAGARDVVLLLPDNDVGTRAALATLPAAMRTGAAVTCSWIHGHDMLSSLAKMDPDKVLEHASGATEIFASTVDRIARTGELDDPSQLLGIVTRTCRLLAPAAHGDHPAASIIAQVAAERFGVLDPGLLMGPLLGSGPVGTPPNRPPPADGRVSRTELVRQTYPLASEKAAWQPDIMARGHKARIAAPAAPTHDRPSPQR